MMGNERLQAMRASQNPMTRQKRRANTHQRTQAPDPNAQIQQPGGQGPGDEQSSDPRRDSYLERLDAMRSATPAVSLSSGGRAPSGGQQNPTGGNSSTAAPEVDLLPTQAMLHEKLRRLMALQDQINQGSMA